MDWLWFGKVYIRQSSKISLATLGIQFYFEIVFLGHCVSNRTPFIEDKLLLYFIRVLLCPHDYSWLAVVLMFVKLKK